MILIICLSILFLTGVVIARRSYYYDNEGFLLASGCGILLFLCMITIPIKRISCRDFEARYHEFKKTILIARSNPRLTEFERASITIRISEFNEEIAANRYYNTIWDLWIPDEVINLEPIQ